MYMVGVGNQMEMGGPSRREAGGKFEREWTSW